MSGRATTHHSATDMTHKRHGEWTELLALVDETINASTGDTVTLSIPEHLLFRAKSYEYVARRLP